MKILLIIMICLMGCYDDTHNPCDQGAEREVIINGYRVPQCCCECGEWGTCTKEIDADGNVKEGCEVQQ